jgi:hypothetical protein
MVGGQYIINAVIGNFKTVKPIDAKLKLPLIPDTFKMKMATTYHLEFV